LYIAEKDAAADFIIRGKPVGRTWFQGVF
jgi:hypothetical protein